MRRVKGARVLLAAATCSLLPLLSFSAVPASAALTSKEVDFVATEKIGPACIPVEEFDGESMKQLIAQLPDAMDLLEQLECI